MDEPTSEEVIIQSRKRPRCGRKNLQAAKCQICEAVCPQWELRNVRIWSEKLLLVLGALNRKTLTLLAAQRLSAAACVFLVCPRHLVETCDEIYAMLEVTSPFEVPNARVDLVMQAMQTVDSFQTGCECLPLVSNWHFLQVCYSFLVRYLHDDGKVPLPIRNLVVGQSAAEFHSSLKRSGAGRDYRLRCRVCDDIQCPRDIKHVTLRAEKLIVLMAAIDRDQIPISMAAHLYTLSMMLTCRQHLPDACDALLAMMKVSDVRDLSRLFTGEKKEVAEAVELANCIIASGEQISVAEFLKMIYDVCWQYSYCSRESKKQHASLDMINDTEIEVAKEVIIESSADVDDTVEECNPDEAAAVSTLPSCEICAKSDASVQFISVRSEKLFFLLVALHRSQLKRDAARALFAHPTLYICREHLVDASADLLDMLGLDEVPVTVPRIDETIDRVLQLTNYLRPVNHPIQEAAFFQLCREFCKKYGGGEEPQTDTVEACRVCGVVRRNSEMRSVSVLSEKMIVLVTEVSRGGMSKTLARQYFHQLKELTVCQWHLVDVCKKLCTMFNVARPESFHHPQQRLVESTMLLVDDIQKGRHPYATTDGKHFVQQCQRFTNKYWKTKTEH